MKIEEINKREKDFLSNELDYKKVDLFIQYLAKMLTLGEILKITREVSYDMVSYYDDVSKGLLYQRDYSELNREQACYLQSKLRTACDLFLQSMQGNEFSDLYLRETLGK